jgi:2-polyprenyl-6-methoxyphenol hydroxylase-like FAD-dependent oxidoreductase
VHVLLKQGERVIDHYFPELLADLIAGGAYLIDMGGDLRWFNFGNWNTRFRSEMDFFCQSRGFLEWRILQRVASLDGVRMLDDCDVAGYTLDTTGRISGVKIHRARGTEERLEAELVVDASGHGSRTRQWLTEDFRSSRTVGRRAWWTAALCWYTARIHQLTWNDRFAASRFLEVIHLTVRPNALFHRMSFSARWLRVSTRIAWCRSERQGRPD